MADASGDRKVKNTLYVPDLRVNLISIGKITDKGREVIFTDKKAEVVESSGYELLNMKRENELADRNVIMTARKRNSLEKRQLNYQVNGNEKENFGDAGVNRRREDSPEIPTRRGPGSLRGRPRKVYAAAEYSDEIETLTEIPVMDT